MLIPDELVSGIRLTKTSEKQKHAELFGAFDHKDTLTFSLDVPTPFHTSWAKLCLWDDDRQEEKDFDFSYGNGSWILRLPLKTLTKDQNSGLFWYSIVFLTDYGKLRLSFDGASYEPKKGYFDDPFDGFQLTVFEDGFETPAFMKGALMYHIFVDRFARGSKAVPVREDAELETNWERGKLKFAKERGGFIRNDQFFGGTLYGVAEKLPYLKSLGVSVIYLSPIFEAASNHKYDTGSYERVDEMFGGDEALDELLEKAKKEGVSVILDGVFNHTGSDSVYFNKTGRYGKGGAYNDPESPYYPWYSFSKYPDEYRCWWGIPILPAVDTASKDYDSFINGENGIVRKWLRRGVAGWRLDVADELDEGFLRNLKKAARREKKDAYLLGEVWEDASHKVAYGKRRAYFRGNELDGVMNYPLKNAIIAFLREKNSENLKRTALSLYSHYPKAVSDTLMNFLGTHDTPRILTELGGRSPAGYTQTELSEMRMTPSELRRGKELLKLAYLLLITFPGAPCIYYADEAGMEGYSDPFNRRTFPWGNEDEELLLWYRKLGAVRRSQKVFAEGYMKIGTDTPDGVFTIERFDDEGDRILLTVNMSENAYSLDVSGEDLLDGHKYEGTVTIPPKNALFCKLY